MFYWIRLITTFRDGLFSTSLRNISNDMARHLFMYEEHLHNNYLHISAHWVELSWVEFIFFSLNIFLGRKKREQNPFRSSPTSDAHKYSTHTVFSYVMSQAQIDGCHSFCRMFSHFVFHCRHKLTAKSFCSCNAMAIIVIHKKIADVTEQKCACKLVN